MQDDPFPDTYCPSNEKSYELYSAFAYEWKNPYPEKKITKIKAINVSQDMEQTVVLYGIAAIKK